MIRTSIVLPPALHQHLIVLAQQRRRPFSVLIREALIRFAREHEGQQRDRAYAALRKMESMVDAETTSTSATIEDVLYGEQGGWRGMAGTTGMWLLPKT